jgi:hypothetical protein
LEVAAVWLLPVAQQAAQAAAATEAALEAFRAAVERPVRAITAALALDLQTSAVAVVAVLGLLASRDQVLSPATAAMASRHLSADRLSLMQAVAAAVVKLRERPALAGRAAVERDQSSVQEPQARQTLAAAGADRVSTAARNLEATAVPASSLSATTRSRRSS